MALLTAAVFVSGVMLLHTAASDGRIAAIWPAAGIAVASLIIIGRWMWPGVFVGTLGVALSVGNPWPLAIVIAVGATVEALVASSLLKSLRRFDPGLRRVRDVIAFSTLGVLVAPTLGTTISVVGLAANHLVTWADFDEAWLTWFIGDALGILIIGSLAMVLAVAPDLKVFRRSYLELFVTTVVLFGSSFVIMPYLHAGLRPFSYIIFAAVIWAALRFEQPGAVLATSSASILAIAAMMYHMRGYPFGDRAQHLAMLQGSVAVMAFTALILAAVSTERREAEEESRRSESRLRATNRAANLGAWDWDLETDAMTWLEEVPSLRGMEFLNSKEWAERIHPEDRDCVMASIAAARERCGDYNVEYRIESPSGPTVWVMSRGMFLAGPSGKAARAVGVSLDITRRKDTEQELKVREAELRTMAEAVPHLVWTANPDGEFDYVNTRWRDYTGVSLRGNPSWERGALVHPEDANACADCWRRCLETGELLESECRLRRSDETFRWHLVRAVPVLDDSGRVLKWIGTCTDINEQKTNEEVLLRTEKLAATGRLAASIAHEINNPLAAVGNLLYLLSGHPDVSPEAKQYVEMAESELRRVVHITRQTLVFYRESAMPMVLKTTEVLDNVLELYARKLEDSGLTVERRYDSEGLIRTLAGELRQIISNLLINAVEASPAGGKIKIHVVERPDWSHGMRPGVQVTIADEGSGIAREHLHEIFEPFFTTKGEKGTGLGLWVTQNLVAKNGGYTKVRSRTGSTHSGSVFSFFLPSNLSKDSGQTSAKKAAA